VSTYYITLDQSHIILVIVKSQIFGFINLANVLSKFSVIVMYVSKYVNE